MNNYDDDVWGEIALLKEELKHLKIQREMLMRHQVELRLFETQLSAYAQEAKRMADETAAALEGATK